MPTGRLISPEHGHHLADSESRGPRPNDSSSFHFVFMTLTFCATKSIYTLLCANFHPILYISSICSIPLRAVVHKSLIKSLWVSYLIDRSPLQPLAFPSPTLHRLLVCCLIPSSNVTTVFDSPPESANN
jgi:hypothetical protein